MRDVPPVTLDMLAAGMAAYLEFDPEREEPEALVWAILTRGMEAMNLPAQSPDEWQDIF